MAPYFATKHGVVALSEALHFELALNGVTGVGVSVVCPLWVRTGIAESERNAPSDVPRPDYDNDPVAQFFKTAVLDLVGGGIDPTVVADKVTDAVKAGDVMWVLTHEGSLDLAQQRWRAIETGGTPAMWMPL
jgi:short-subunit dehydrogenase